jgi:two-component system sensor histidine kinase UhpB
VGGTSLGLLSIEERAALIGGRALIESTPGHGTTVRAWLPLPPPAAASDS